MISRIFIERPRLAGVVSIVMMLAGILSIFSFESTILTAVGEVRNALMDYREEKDRRSSFRLAVEAARAAEELAKDQYQNGLTDFNNVLDVQRSLLTFQEQLALSEGAVSQNAVRLYKAMGGGWIAME